MGLDDIYASAAGEGRGDVEEQERKRAHHPSIIIDDEIVGLAMSRCSRREHG
ncbi:hypothetical protein A7982_12887 [Minicystis rosea]|nr:hypothetical protein A7982_12887 [Minicystis rosea]